MPFIRSTDGVWVPGADVLPRGQPLPPRNLLSEQSSTSISLRDLLIQCGVRGLSLGAMPPEICGLIVIHPSQCSSLSDALARGLEGDLVWSRKRRGLVFLANGYRIDLLPQHIAAIARRFA